MLLQDRATAIYVIGHSNITCAYPVQRFHERHRITGNVQWEGGSSPGDAAFFSLLKLKYCSDRDQLRKINNLCIAVSFVHLARETYIKSIYGIGKVIMT